MNYELDSTMYAGNYVCEKEQWEKSRNIKSISTTENQEINNYIPYKNQNSNIYYKFCCCIKTRYIKK